MGTLDTVFQPINTMREKIKDLLAIVLILLIIIMWYSIGTGVSQDVIAIETILAGVMVIVISLIHK
jgi:hypothetical protein